MMLVVFQLSSVLPDIVWHNVVVHKSLIALNWDLPVYPQNPLKKYFKNLRYSGGSLYRINLYVRLLWDVLWAINSAQALTSYSPLILCSILTTKVLILRRRLPHGPSPHKYSTSCVILLSLCTFWRLWWEHSSWTTGKLFVLISKNSEH